MNSWKNLDFWLPWENLVCEYRACCIPKSARLQQQSIPWKKHSFSFGAPSTRTRRQWHPTPVFLPGESQGQGSLVGCRLWGHTESDTTEVT